MKIFTAIKSMFSRAKPEVPDTFVDPVVIERVLAMQAKPLNPVNQSRRFDSSVFEAGFSLLPNNHKALMAQNRVLDAAYAGKELPAMPMPAITEPEPRALPSFPPIEPSRVPPVIEPSPSLPAIPFAPVAPEDIKTTQAASPELSSFLKNPNLIVFKGLPPEKGFFLSADGSGIDSKTARQI